MTVEHPRSQYAPSAEKVVPEEAGDPFVRANAKMFVEQLLHEMDRSEYGPNAFVPTPQAILERYQRVKDHWDSPLERLFSLRDAYGAAKRKYFFEKDLASEAFRQTFRVNPLSMENIGNIHVLMTAIEFAYPIILLP